MTQIFLPKLIDISKLRLLPTNSQKQNKEVFEKLKTNISSNGFDESLIVRSVGDDEYEIISGNHRYKAAKELGFTELPCVVRDDWDSIEAELQSVRRNIPDARGALDTHLFTAQVQELQEKHEIDLSEIISGMGFADEDSFAKMYQQAVKNEEEEEILAIIEEENEKEETDSVDAGIVKMVENLDLIISQILNEHGHTIKNGFLILPVGGKTHLFISANRKLKDAVQEIAKAAFTKGLDINVALAGLLSIGVAQTDFLDRNDGAVVKGEGGDPDDEGIEFEGI